VDGDAALQAATKQLVKDVSDELGLHEAHARDYVLRAAQVTSLPDDAVFFPPGTQHLTRAKRLCMYERRETLRAVEAVLQARLAAASALPAALAEELVALTDAAMVSLRVTFTRRTTGVAGASHHALPPVPRCAGGLACRFCQLPRGGPCVARGCAGVG